MPLQSKNEGIKEMKSEKRSPMLFFSFAIFPLLEWKCFCFAFLARPHNVILCIGKNSSVAEGKGTVMNGMGLTGREGQKVCIFSAVGVLEQCVCYKTVSESLESVITTCISRHLLYQSYVWLSCNIGSNTGRA